MDDFFSKLPSELSSKILEKISFKERLELTKVSKLWDFQNKESFETEDVTSLKADGVNVAYLVHKIQVRHDFVQAAAVVQAAAIVQAAAVIQAAVVQNVAVVQAAVVVQVAAFAKAAAIVQDAAVEQDAEVVQAAAVAQAAA